MFGGTATNIAASFLGASQVEVVTGVNLPMVIKLAGLRHKASNLLAVAKEMREHGRNAIWVASELLRSEKSPA
jgi:PTS system mannose-specific IIA component